MLLTLAWHLFARLRLFDHYSNGLLIPLNHLSPNIKWCMNRSLSVERRVLDWTWTGSGSIPTGGDILSLDFFHVVKPLMPILALLSISFSL